ncbi:prophage DNA circulation protein [Agrobacterium vitis]|nr:prophage DNA circulation protein [Agrobacterium vitis]
MARDWSSTLWPASFMGFPFHVSRDDRQGKRRLVVHELPLNDVPLIQDMGAGATKITVDAYFLSDSADAQAKAFEAVLKAGGVGPLSLPTLGIKSARAEEWKPSFDAERLGYIGFSITFVLDPGGSALGSIFYAVAEIFAAAEGLASVAGAVIGALELVGHIGSVVGAAQSAFETSLATLSVISTSETVKTDTLATFNSGLQTLYNSTAIGLTASGVDGDLGSSLVDLARMLGDGMGADDAARAFGALLDSEPASTLTGSVAALSSAQPWLGTVAQQAINRNAARFDLALKLAALAAYAEAIGRQEFASRPEGINARALMAERLDIALAAAEGAEMVDVYAAIESLQGQLADYLSRKIITLAPVVTVTANASVPALVWAWRLYADPARADELVARNKVIHPLFMPQNFEALES